MNIEERSTALAEAYSDICQTSTMELFENALNGFWPLTIFVKSSILDVWQGFQNVCLET